jgi:hypothetical protein
MAADLQDYSQGVQVLGGSVSITGTATVIISGTVPVSISGTPTVNIGTAPTINVSGSVAITGTPTVNINTGQSVGITGTVTVAISGTPAVTVSSGSVSISGTPNVNIASQTGNLNVVFPSAQAVTISSGTVTISGTVPVTISSGTVSITGTANINIAAQSITVGVNLPWTAQGSKTTVGAGSETFTTTAVPAGTQTLGLLIEAGQFITALVVRGVTSQAFYEDSQTGTFGGLSHTGWLTIPVNAARDSQYSITWGTSSGAGTVIGAYASGLAMGYPALGQNPMSESVPVAIASDQPPITVQDQIPVVASYRAVGVFNCAANPTDVAQLLGSSTKTLYVTLVRVGLLETTAALNNLFLIKRTTNDTGASTVALATALDSNDPASTAGDTVHGISVYTVNPTPLGTAPGSGIGGIRVFAPAAATTSYSASQAWEFGIRGAKPVVLRGTTEGLYVNLGGSGNAGLAVVVEFEWYEI